VGAEKGERTAGRQSYRSGYYGPTLITRVGKLELRVPQDRAGRFSTELFESYQRSERALVTALAEMYVQGLRSRIRCCTARRADAEDQIEQKRRQDAN
jgi:transposase-like protein